MSSHEEFLKDVEADLARLNSVLLEVEEEENILSLHSNPTDNLTLSEEKAGSFVTDCTTSNMDDIQIGENSETINDDTNTLEMEKMGTGCETDSAKTENGEANCENSNSNNETSNTNSETSNTTSENSNTISLEREANDEMVKSGPVRGRELKDTTCQQEGSSVHSSLTPEESGEVDMPDLASLKALLLKVDQVLQKREGDEEEAEKGDYEQFSADQPDTLGEEAEEEEEEEDYFKSMNQFVDSETVDLERLYDVLEMNLQYQDFLSKLNGEVERRLQKNRDKQKQIGEEEDHLFLVSQGLMDKDCRTRTTNSKVISLQRFKAPYFSNHYKIGPRMNHDQLKLSNNPRYQVYMYESSWGKNDRSALVDCVKNCVIEEKMSEALCGRKRVREDLDLYHEELESSTLEELFKSGEVESWSELQWLEVMQGMSSLSNLRSAADCANQWKNYVSPFVNKEVWSSKEDALLERLVREHGVNSWPLIAHSLNTGRKGWQCLQRYHKIQRRPVSNWTVADDKHITDAVMIYGEASFADLSYYMGDKNSDQCLQRWRYSLRPQIKRGKWTAEEDQEVMNIVSEHGFDWQKIKDVQKHRTRAQVRERVRILTAKDRSGSNGGARHWSVEETFLLMSRIKRHGSRNWSAIRKDFQLKYTAPVLFRRWVRVQSLLDGSCKRIHLPWERTVMNELLKPKRYLNRARQEELADMLPGPEQKERIEEILERCKIHGRTALYKTELKRRVQELDEETEEEPPTFLPSSSHQGHSQYQLLRTNTANIYKKAFEVGNDAEFKMYYTPPSSTTLSAFRTLLVEHMPKLQEQAGLRPHEHVDLPEELVQSGEFGVLAARFKSLFSWPLIMGETPV